MRNKPPHLSRRRFLKSTAAGLSTIAMSGIAWGQLATQPRAKPVPPDEFPVAAPVSIEVNARPIPAFEPGDRSRVRFGALEYRSGLVLTSRFPGFGGLSGIRLDPKASASSRSATRETGSPAASPIRAAR